MLNKLIHCSNIRQEQLKREEKIDQQLQKCSSKAIGTYLLAYRTLNRHMSTQLYNTPVYSAPTVLIEQLDKIDEHLTKMENIQCSQLNDMAKEMLAHIE